MAIIGERLVRLAFPPLEGQPVRMQVKLHVLTGAQQLLDMAAHRTLAKVSCMEGLDEKRRNQAVPAQRLDQEPQRLPPAGYLAPDRLLNKRLLAGISKRAADRRLGVDRQDDFCPFSGSRKLRQESALYPLYGRVPALRYYHPCKMLLPFATR